MSKLPNWFSLLLFFLLAVNVLFLDLTLLTKKDQDSSGGHFQKWIEEDQEECGPTCVDEKISQAVASISAAPKKSVAAAPKTTTILPSPIKVTSYISLGAGGSTKNTDWTRIDGTEFTFDLSDYPGGKVYWEGNLRAQYSNSRCYARLFDKTNGRSVDYSEQSTDKTENQYLTSSELTIWHGKLKYQLEIKSLNGITCYLDSPRSVVKY